MSLNPTGANSASWNYSNPDKEGFSEVLVGTVVCVQEVQKRSFTRDGKPGAPEFWPEGNPKMNIRIGLADVEGNLKTFTFQPAGKDAKAGNKPSVHMDLWHLTGDTDMMNLIGKTIQISTQTIDPATGMKVTYGAGNPRRFQVQLTDFGPYHLNHPMPAEYQAAEVLCNDAATGGAVAPQNIQVPPTAYSPYPAQPPMGQPGQPAMYAMGTKQTVVPPQPQPAQPAVQPIAPAGMDPQVAAAMQQLGATTVQPVAPVEPKIVDGTQGQIYEDVPF